MTRHSAPTLCIASVIALCASAASAQTTPLPLAEAPQRSGIRMLPNAKIPTAPDPPPPPAVPSAQPPPKTQPPASESIPTPAPVEPQTPPEVQTIPRPSVRPATMPVWAYNISALTVEVTITRFQGDKRVSNTPHSLAVMPDGRVANLRIGGEVPVASIKGSPASSYRSIGTNIDVTATPGSEEGRYRLQVGVEESSVYSSPDSSVSSSDGAPSFRSFRSSNAVSLRNGQTLEYIAATDRISGETARITVKLTVLK